MSARPGGRDSTNPPIPVDHPPLGPTGKARGKWGDLRMRVVSAAVLIPLALLALWAGGIVFGLWVAAIAAGLAFEWLGLCRRMDMTAMVLFAALPAAVLLATSGAAASAFLLLLATMIAAAIATRGGEGSRLLPLGLPYLGIGAVAFAWLRQPPDTGLVNVLVLLLVVWASDIGAYLVGRAVGGPLLAPAISPGKTWSGAIGGLLAAAGVGLTSAYILDGTHPSRSALLAALTGIAAQLGDLLESRLKRHFGVKDSGWLIPGHGGLLDRLDALLTAAPVAALLAQILGRGVVLWK